MAFVSIASRSDQYDYLTSGLVLPDLETEENAALVQKFEGSWSYLTTFKWMRIWSDGTVKHASFPPKGDH